MNYRYFVGDFETTVYEGQATTEVWASAVVEMYTEDVYILHSIEETLDLLFSMNCNIKIYYHNLKFDGHFWLDLLIRKMKMKQAYYMLDGKEKWIDTKKMLNNTFKYMISDKGQWYSITIKHNKHYIEIIDSLKLLPFSVKKLGKEFQTKHQKLEMEYTGIRYSGCKISNEEKEYIKNDVLVVKEALEIMFNDGHDKMTIGSCCMKEFKATLDFNRYKELFPNVYKIKIDKDKYDFDNVGEYILKSYRGAWCYIKDGCENKVYHKGLTIDINSLYPYVMHSNSGNRYPVGKPIFWCGNKIPEQAERKNTYYFIRCRFRFKLKEGYLPFIQIKGTYLYPPNECLKTSDVYDSKTDTYSRYYIDLNGKKHDTYVTMTLTMTDYNLIMKHYELYDFEILSGCWFFTMTGIFDEYIDKWAEIKMNNTGAIRTEAKLFQNNLYGKMATSTNSSFKIAYLDENDIIKFNFVSEHDKEPGYIPIGSAITSYAREYTISHAQDNYGHFVYSDTDSLHCNCDVDELNNIEIHETEYGKWKVETCFDEAIFVRQKTYIEHVTHENLKQLDESYYLIKSAGMPERCKNKISDSLNNNKMKITDFTKGFEVEGNLRPKRIKGGIVLEERTFKIR